LKAKKLISVMDTSFRDGLQSVYGGRVLLEDIKPAIEAFVDAGIEHFEFGGGARFQSLYFYCNEDAFDMMDAFRSIVGPKVKLQTLSRGVSHVGLDTGSRDVIDLHAKLFKKHGATTIRNFDALNDVQNLIYPAECIKKHGLNHEVCVTVMELPPGCEGAHEADFYMGVLRNILDSGLPFDSVCFKDASGTARPRKIYDTIKAARELLGQDMHIRFHTHETAGVSVACYLAALEAGADGIDLAMDPVSGGTSQPDMLTMLHALKGSEFDMGLEAKKLLEAQKVLKDCLKDYFVPPEAKEVCTLIPFSPMPGGALTANTQMMRDTKTLDKLPAALEAMGEVVARGGFGTSVTPVSQFYFQQAFNNVVFGPWKKIADGYGKMLLGYFGKTPVAPDAELVKIAKEQLNLEPSNENPLDVADRDFNKSLACFEEQLRHNNLPITEENLFIVATCAEKGIAFLKGEAKVNVRKVDHLAAEGGAKAEDKIVHDMFEKFDSYSVTAPEAKLKVSVLPEFSSEYEGSWSKKNLSFKLERKAKDLSAGATGGMDADGNIHVHAPLPSEVIKVLVQVGDEVKDGQDLLILEAMKMVMEVQAPADGIVKAIHVKQGGTVESGQVLVTLE
jgi:pyruvate carboxylase subunit B